MTETAAPAPATPKAKKPAKAKKPSTHPGYSEMVKQAITSLSEKNGSSRQAIVKYILKNFKLSTNEKAVTVQTKMALRRDVASGVLKQSKGTGASGSFKIGAKKEEKKAKAKKSTKSKVKPKAAKKSPKKPTNKSKKVKKPRAPKPQKSKSPKKAAKRVAKPKKVTKPKKAKATKKAAKK
ncbi:histone H1-delta [Octopus bimaculoides]|uniref:H15 domain-containing protein n=1 Tax=Octopus bimaculoides TaxID=37653 RepID=A0A0L8GXX4_OCTBM|nr:histone H1-delta [Octopus bimaculoides]|eukprot:XP_014777386.1 PREDICTED: histone H1-delta-like [Octopus bimaculoides]